MTLLVSLQPYSDESLSGFLRRVSERNFAPSVGAFLKCIGLKSRLTYSESELARLSSELGVGVAELTRRQVQQESIAALLQAKHHGRSVKICPLCIAQAPYERIGWTHGAITACPHHEVRLVSHCGACNHTIGRDSSLEICRCGSAHAHAPAIAASRGELALSALLLDVDHVARHSLPLAWQRGLAPVDIVDLLSLLGRHFPGDAALAPQSKISSGKPTIDVLGARTLSGIELMMDWPNRFDNALAMRLKSTEGPGLAKRLGVWYRELHQRYLNTAYDCLRNALVQHLSEGFDGHLNLRISTLDPQHLQGKCWLTSEEAGRLIGMGSELVRTAVITGEIEGKHTVRGQNRFVSIHRNVVEQVRRDRQQYFDATTTRKQLGVSKVVFERLMQAGALRKRTKSERPPLVAGEFFAEEVLALVARLAGSLDVRDVPSERLVGLHDISGRRGISTDSICNVLHRILASEIRPVLIVTSLHGLAGLRFDLQDITNNVIDTEREPMLLVTDIVRLRGWKHENILQWIKQGVLGAVTQIHAGRPQHRIPLSALLDFMSNYAVLADLASRSGSKSNHLLLSLKPAKVAPVGVAGCGVKRGVLVRIDDLLRAAQLNKRQQASS